MKPVTERLIQITAICIITFLLWSVSGGPTLVGMWLRAAQGLEGCKQALRAETAKVPKSPGGG